MTFITHAEISAREAARTAAVAEIAAAVAAMDPAPLRPFDDYLGGEHFEGCYSGKIVALNGSYLAIWSRLANRVAILPLTGLAQTPPMNSICAIRACFNSYRAVAPLTVDYDWLDAFDDFLCALQTTRDLLTSGLRSEMFVLNERGNVRGEYRDIHAQNIRARSDCYRGDRLDIFVDDHVRVLPGGDVHGAEDGTVTSVTNHSIYVLLNGPRVVCVPRVRVRLLEPELATV